MQLNKVWWWHDNIWVVTRYDETLRSFHIRISEAVGSELSWQQVSMVCSVILSRSEFSLPNLWTDGAEHSVPATLSSAWLWKRWKSLFVLRVVELQDCNVYHDLLLTYMEGLKNTNLQVWALCMSIAHGSCDQQKFPYVSLQLSLRRASSSWNTTC